MDYTRVYGEIVKRAKLRPAPAGYTEKHHIIPRFMNGADDESNIAILTAREHFICHWLLWRILGTRQAAAAFNFMRASPNKSGERYFNSLAYAEAVKAKKKTARPRKKRQEKTNAQTPPCPHCGKVTRYVKNMKEYHYDNCWKKEKAA